MIQPCFRLISNLIIICYKDIKDAELLSQFIQSLLSKESIFQFIKDIFSSQSNKYDISLIEDILLLVFNLVNITPNNNCAFFKNIIINIITGKEYENNNKILKLLFFIYYKILRINSFYFEPNDENVIKSSFILLQNFKDDNSILYIFIDLYYFYSKALNIQIDGNVENDIKRMINTKEDIPNNDLIKILFNLSNYMKLTFNQV